MIDQKGYIWDLLKSEGMTLSHLIVLPVKTGSTLFLDQISDYQQAKLTTYQQLVEKFMYLSCETRPDIAFVVRQLSCHNSHLRVGHLRIVK